MPNWNMRYGIIELALWHLDQRIYDSGVYIDVDLAQKAVECINIEQQQLADETNSMTKGEMQTATERDAMLRHIVGAYGITLNDLTASTIESRLNDLDLPNGLKELLAVCQQASTTNTNKYKALLKRVSSDNRLRATLQFMGAAPRTGRRAGRGFQPQNLTRPTMADWEIEMGIDAIKSCNAGLLTDNIMKLTSNTLRGAFVRLRVKSWWFLIYLILRVGC